MSNVILCNFIQVLEVQEETFFVQFFQKSGTLGRCYVPNVQDKSLIERGPPNNFKWTVLTPFEYSIITEGRYVFQI